MLRSGTNDSNWVFLEEEDIHEVQQDQIIASQINVIHHHSATRILCSIDRGPWYGQDFGKLFGNQEAPTFSGVLCGTYEGITKEKFIFSFSMWDSPQNWNFAFFCIKKNLLYLESNAWPKMLLL